MQHPSPLLAIISTALVMSFGVQAQPADPVDAAIERLRALLPLINANDLACHFRPTVWAGLPVTVRVAWSETRDGKPRVFVMNKGGVLSEEKDLDGLASGLTKGITIAREYGITFASANDAFAKGAPFYITEVAFESPVKFHYTVISNPKFPNLRGQVAIQETGEGYNIGMVSGRVTSKPEPQRLQETLTSPLDSKKKTYLSIVEDGCIASNDVLLGSGTASKP